MESECDENNSTMKRDSDPPDSLSPNEENIVKILVAISNQMMANTQDLQNQILRNHQDLQDQLTRNNLKLTAEIQRLNQDHEAFKQQSRAAFMSLQSSPLPTNFPQVSNPIPDPGSSVGGIPVSHSTGLSLTSPVLAQPSSTATMRLSVPSASLSNDAFQAQI
jgi:hypothetical protein